MFRRPYLPMTYTIALDLEKGDLIEYEEEPSKYKQHKVWNFKQSDYPRTVGVKIITNQMSREEALTHLESLRLLFKKEIKANVIRDDNRTENHSAKLH